MFAFSLFGYQFFIPQILRQFGMETNLIGWVAALPPVLAVVPMVWWSRHSDRSRERIRHFAASAATASVGFLAAGLLIDQPVLAIAGFCVAGIGLYCCIPIQLSIPSTFLAGSALAAGLATINGLGNIGGYIGPQVTGIIREATGDFRLAVLVMGVSIMGSAVLALVLDLRIRRAKAAATRAAVLDAS
ncbi:MFS transporter [Nonomuraea antimicrobica]